MSWLLRIDLVVASVIFLLFVLHKVRQDRFLLQYSFAWVVLGVLGVIAAIFPELVGIIASALGFQAPSSFLFVVSILFLMVISLIFISALSRQQRMIVRLVQEVSLLKMKKHVEEETK